MSSKKQLALEALADVIGDEDTAKVEAIVRDQANSVAWEMLADTTSGKLRSNVYWALTIRNRRQGDPALNPQDYCIPQIAEHGLWSLIAAGLLAIDYDDPDTPRMYAHAINSQRVYLPLHKPQ